MDTIKKLKEEAPSCHGCIRCDVCFVYKYFLDNKDARKIFEDYKFQKIASLCTFYIPEEEGYKTELEIMIGSLCRTIKNYENVFSEVGVEKDIVDTYNFKKPLTSIEIYGKDVEEVVELLDALDQFFFSVLMVLTDNGLKAVNMIPNSIEFNGVILISRFKTLVEVALEYKLTDKNADLAGILYGYNPKSVAQYCSDERMKSFGLVK